jgi:hypothetical protein
VVDGAGWVVPVTATPPRVEAGAARSWPGLTAASALVVGGAARSPGRSDGKAPVSQAVSSPPMSSRASALRSRRPARRGTGGAGGGTGLVRGWDGAVSVEGSTVGALAASDAGASDGLLVAIAMGATGVLGSCG